MSDIHKRMSDHQKTHTDKKCNNILCTKVHCGCPGRAKILTKGGRTRKIRIHREHCKYYDSNKVKGVANDRT